MSAYPKRLIEVDLPIKRVSAHARREKSIRHGHISTLHIWWARRPLAACRAVICAALWPDPADPLCPQSFRDEATRLILQFAHRAVSDKTIADHASQQSWGRWTALVSSGELDPTNPAHLNVLRFALLDFIADFANWDNSTVPAYLETSRALTQSAHIALGGAPGTRPLIVDPFAGGGSIPLEALRVGADAFASDLNPVAVLLNKVVLEYIPKYGQRLADEVRKWGQWIREEAENELAEFYPKDPDGATPIAYLWARTIISEAPDDGTGIPVELPLIRSFWLAKRPKNPVALRWLRDSLGHVHTETVVVEYADGTRRTVRRPILEIFEPRRTSDVESGTTARGAVTCPVTGYTTPVTSVRSQLRSRHGGAADARLYAVVTTRPDHAKRYYRLATDRDRCLIERASAELRGRAASASGEVPLIPNDPLPRIGTIGFRVQLYGATLWSDLLTPRQLLVLTTMARLINELGQEVHAQHDPGLMTAAQVILALNLDKQADYLSSICTWHFSLREKVNHTFARNAMPFVSDFVETVFFGSGSGNWNGLLDWTVMAIEQSHFVQHTGTAEQASATSIPLPDTSCQIFLTDPPYYDAIPYADLSDFFYVWLKRTVPDLVDHSSPNGLTPKGDECIVDEANGKDRAHFRPTMSDAMREGRRVTGSDGIGIIVFAHKSTTGWESQLQSMVDAGWTVTGSWPIDTEMGTRLRAHDSAALASSIHLVCRPRETANSALSRDLGDWRDVLDELPPRIHEWMPRLADEGVVGADAIFACLGPALEIFSRYERVEKASGEVVKLPEYLEHVWAAVAREALSTIFAGAETSGLEADARLTAMWLWTVAAGHASPNGAAASETADADETLDDEEAGGKKAAPAGFALEYDAARKIAQGLGAHLDKLGHVVVVKGDSARLLSVGERTRYLFGSDGRQATAARKPRAGQQLSMFTELAQAEEETSWGIGGAPPAGKTVLDRVHQAMILFGAGRSEALKRFLVEEGAGNEQALWRLAQSLSALYPAGSEEKRWVDGVLARKKGLGF